MSVCRVCSLSLVGIDALPVEVEVDVGAGLPGFSIVGLPDAAVQEARERVRVAISNNGYKFPTERVIVNLAPANLRKEGSAFDLPIALAVLAASRVVPEKGLDGICVVGELSLDGGLWGVRALDGRKREKGRDRSLRSAGAECPRGCLDRWSRRVRDTFVIGGGWLHHGREGSHAVEARGERSGEGGRAGR
jgi:hypothetical protein